MPLSKEKYIQTRTVGIIHLLLGIGILLFLIFEPGSRMILPILFPLMLIYIIVGYRFITLKQKNRVFSLVSALLIILFIIGQLPHSLTLIARGYSKGLTALLDVTINGGLLLLNGYVIYVLYFSRVKNILKG